MIICITLGLERCHVGCMSTYCCCDKSVPDLVEKQKKMIDVDTKVAQKSRTIHSSILEDHAIIIIMSCCSWFFVCIISHNALEKKQCPGIFVEMQKTIFILNFGPDFFARYLDNFTAHCRCLYIKHTLANLHFGSKKSTLMNTSFSCLFTFY